MSDTPKTDAATFTVMLAPSTLDNAMMLPRKVVPVALAHKLERELSAVTRERDEARQDAYAWSTEALERVGKLHAERDALRAEVERLRGALLALANAADDVGVEFFDMEDPPISVAQMQSATLAARGALQEPTP